MGLSIHSVPNPLVASMRLILVLLLVACLFALIADSRRKPQKKPSKKPPKKPSKPAKKPGRPAKPGKIAFFLFAIIQIRDIWATNHFRTCIDFNFWRHLECIIVQTYI